MKIKLTPLPGWTVTLMLTLAVALSVPAQPSAAADASTSMRSSDGRPGQLDPSLRHEVDAAIARGLDWLKNQQHPDGSWSDTNFPAITALPLWAFTRSSHPDREQVVSRAVAFILTCAREDGSIYREVPGRKGGGLSNYNTAICMTALQATGRPDVTPVVLKARTYMAGAQYLGDDEYRGGFGYDKATGRAYTDLLDTFYAAQAMRLTESAEESRPAGQRRADIDWAATVKYVERLQNKPESGTNNAGGFFYNPTDPKAGTVTNAQGVVFFRSFGSITYTGMLALLYANVDRDDVRVRSAVEWAERNWTLDENPGMGPQGLYFFYNILTRSLDAARVDSIKRPGNEFVDWRESVAKRLVSLQKIDSKTGTGYWVNENGRYWENNDVLVTSYVLQALLTL